MMDRISCLIIESDQEAVRQIDNLARLVGSIEIRWKTTSLQTGIEILRKHHPEMAIIGLSGNPASAIESISSMARDFPGLYLMGLSDTADAGLILQVMRAGANDFLHKPVKEIDLRAAAEKIFKLKAAKKETTGGGGRIISVFSNKGGNGVTTIAANLSAAMSRYHGKKTVVVDLVLSQGDLSMFFNVSPSYSILDLAKNATKADYDFLHTLLVKHSSGVYILAEPPMIEDTEEITPASVREVLSTLRSMFDVIIVDTPHQFDERTLMALDMSDQILLVTLLNIPSLKNTLKCLELFGRIGLRDDRMRLLISRYLPSDEIPKEKIEGILKLPVSFTIPNDYPVVISSVNRGKLLYEIAPDKEVTRSFRRMADLLLGPVSVQKPVSGERKRGLFGRLFNSERSSQ